MIEKPEATKIVEVRVSSRKKAETFQARTSPNFQSNSKSKNGS
jgi:hypothetical protein